MAPSASPTDRNGWDVIAPKVWPSTPTKTRRPTLWKRRAVEKSKKRLFHRACKSRPDRGIATFPQRRRRLAYEPTKKQNRTFHLLPKADILTCYEQRQRRVPQVRVPQLDANLGGGRCERDHRSRLTHGLAPSIPIRSPPLRPRVKRRSGLVNAERPKSEVPQGLKPGIYKAGFGTAEEAAEKSDGI